jgi:Flp pilus assembly protein TadD
MEASDGELNRTGRRMLAAGMPAYAVATFERAVRDYPDQWTSHAGLADALEAAGDRDRAAEHYVHARERAPEDRRAQLDAALARVQGPPPSEAPAP